MDFLDDGIGLRLPSRVGWVRQQWAAGLCSLTGERSDGERHHHAGRDSACQHSGFRGQGFDGEHHAGAQRVAHGGGCCAGLGYGRDRVDADVRIECRVYCNCDQRAGDAYGDGGIGKPAELKFDYAYADADLIGGGTADSSGDNVAAGLPIEKQSCFAETEINGVQREALQLTRLDCK